MGKKGRRTRWRTLTITDEHSDSEESSTTTSGHRVPKGYPQRPFYSRFTYSTQSTPTRRCDGTKSTRSSSTASENKITFNEDEYTRITTPRQDVLFKKGYLNKPKNFQTQTSTGNSTTSTGNSTGNGTPDHQSTDLEYESQFVFPNGFVDQNGIYYVNSFEPFPVVVYNPPTYYPEYTNVKTKRCSTGSLTESTSPNNEETSQDLSQSETPSNVSELNHVYNVIYPGYYYNSACPAQDAVYEPEPRRLKKRRRRKLSRSKQEGTTSESSDEVFSEVEEDTTKADQEKEISEAAGAEEDKKPEEVDDAQPEQTPEETETTKSAECPKTKYDLKPDAEEFVPRAYRQAETIPMEANVQFIKIPSNFVPVPILNPMGEFNAFIPPGIPINFIPQNYVNFVPYKHPNNAQNPDEKPEEDKEQVKETVQVPKNQIDIAKIVSKLEEAAKEQDKDETAVKEETQNNRNVRKRHKYQKVDLRKPEEKTPTTSPKKEETVPKPARNYSDTLKKSMVSQPCERHERHMEKSKTKTSTTKETPVKNHQRVERTPPKTTNEWIAVSRKKRKNKNTEETDDFEEKEPVESVELSEIQEIRETVEVPPLPVEEPVEPPPQIQEIIEEAPQTQPVPVPEEKKPKKKPKKNTSKPAPLPTKRVIITDVDLSVPEPEVKEPLEVKEPPEETIPKPIEEEQEEKKEQTPEKKTKKKKKKPIPPKPSIQNTDSSSNTTLNITDDSYDFLLDESLDKTNVEVSQELDKMIQRGMYSNLEEKIKSMNIESNDSFFKTIISNISSREPSVEKNNTYIKSPNFTRLNTNLMKPLPRSDDFLAEPTILDDGEIGDGDKVKHDDRLYPITRAVKEWMMKTRETTPDVEILKSPSTILREFAMEEEEDEENEEWERVRKTSASSIEEAEECLEEETTKSYPKHGNLPYRAICCSIM